MLCAAKQRLKGLITILLHLCVPGGVSPAVLWVVCSLGVARIASSMAHRRAAYTAALTAQGLTVKPVAGDGNCLFRAAADQLYGDEAAHPAVRAAATDLMTFDAAWFAGFVAGDIDEYVGDMRKPGTWGDDPEIQCIADVYARPVEVWGYAEETGARRLRVFASSRAPKAGGAPPIRLSFFLGGHFDSVRGACWAASRMTGAVGDAEAAFFTKARAIAARNDAALRRRKAAALAAKAASASRRDRKAPPKAAAAATRSSGRTLRTAAQ